jgi:hypothetical protein
MGPIEPQRERRREIAQSNPPPWRLAGGMLNGGFTFEHRDGSRVHYHSENGDLVLVAWDSAGETKLPDREDLEAVAHHELSALQESKRPEDQALLILSGVGRYSVVRNHRGRRRRWTDEERARFAREFVGLGERWTDAHERWARQSWDLSWRQALDVMRQAEACGVVMITKSAGRNSPNVYRLTGFEPTPPDARARADWHRTSWLELERKRRELEGSARGASNLANS